jgi:hypothetical protein
MATFLSDQNGYPTESFTDKVDDKLLCPACDSVCRDAFSSSCCGRVMCNTCVDRWLAHSSNTRCPLAGCSQPSSPSHFTLCQFANLLIRSLPIRCSLGCDIKGLVVGKDEKTFTDHVDGVCVNNTVPCPLSCFERKAQQLNPSSSSSSRYHDSLTFSFQRDNGKDSVGQLLDAKDDRKVWLPAGVIELSSSNVFIHYLGSANKWDEWIPVDSARLAPLHTHTALDLLQSRHEKEDDLQSSSSSSFASVRLVPSLVRRSTLNEHLTRHCPNATGVCKCGTRVKRCEMEEHLRSIDDHFTVDARQ